MEKVADYSDLSVIIAAYNEEKNIKSAIEKVLSVLPGSEIVIVDDGSSDKTYQMALDFKPPNMKVIRLKKNRGKGRAVREGIKEASRKIMAQLDADMQFLPEDLKKMIEPIRRNEADIVIGSRYRTGSYLEDKSVTLPKKIASFMMSAIVSIFCGQRVTDAFAGIKAWDSQAAREIGLREDGFSYEAEIIIAGRCLKKRIVEMPVFYMKRIHGKSKIKFLRDAVVVPYSIIRIIARRCLFGNKSG